MSPLNLGRLDVTVTDFATELGCHAVAYYLDVEPQVQAVFHWPGTGASSAQALEGRCAGLPSAFLLDLIPLC